MNFLIFIIFLDKELKSLLLSRHKDAADRVPYRSIKSNMKKWRREIFPTNIKTLDDFTNAFQDEKIKKLFQNNHVKMHVKLVIDENDDQHVLFYDPEFISKNFKTVQRLYIDGTFKIIPLLEKAYQNFTILGVLIEQISIYSGFPKMANYPLIIDINKL